MAVAAGVLAGAGSAAAPSAAGASAEELLARALEVIDRQSARIDDLARENAELREQNAQLVRVKVVDCLCSRAGGLDLYAAAFSRLAPLSVGMFDGTWVRS